jgi:predicted RNA-binding protein YlxR (DUF448 family)
MSEKKKPMRKCVVTGERVYKMDLLRIVKTKDGKVFVDESSKANGKGVYIKKDNDVLKKAKAKKMLERALETKDLSNIYEEIEKTINK